MVNSSATLRVLLRNRSLCGKAKHGACYAHSGVLGYHPLVAVRADTGEVLHSRMRSGSSQRGHEHFARETLARVRRLAADARVTVRADSGFFSHDMIAAIGAHNACYSITIPQNAKVKAANEAIGEDAWKAIAYTRGGEAQVAETTIEAGRRGDKLRGDDGKPAKLRLVTRRSRLLGAQGELWPNWRYHSFVTDRDDLDTKAADAYHRNHATVELAIRDLKDNGLRRCPSGRFFANGAWLACSVLAHNLARWTAASGAPTPRANSPSRPPSATGSSPCRAASSTTATATDCACRSTGHGHTPSPPPWDTSPTCPNSSEPPTAPGAAQPNPKRHQPAPAPHPNPARPKTRRPAYTHQPSGHPAPTADPTNPSVDSGLGQVCEKGDQHLLWRE